MAYSTAFELPGKVLIARLKQVEGGVVSREFMAFDWFAPKHTWSLFKPLVFWLELVFRSDLILLVPVAGIFQTMSPKCAKAAERNGAHWSSKGP